MAARVVDASVLGALLFGEPRASKAAALLDGHDLFAPPLVFYELASVAAKKARLYPDRRAALLQALDIGLSLQITEVETDHPAVVELALETGLTTYDAAYLHLARALSAPLVTFDNRLRRLP